MGSGWVVVALWLCCSLFNGASSQSCADIGCCPGTDNDCIANDCFCDEACFTIFNDCCTDYLDLCGGSDGISAFPRFGTMLGGTRVIINGPINTFSVVTCQFGSSLSVPGQVQSAGRAMCISPTYFDVGRVPLSVMIDNSLFRSNFLYIAVDQIEDGVIRVNRQQWLPGGGPFQITWNDGLLNTASVDVELWNYRELTRGVPNFNRELLIVQEVPNNGLFTFNQPKAAERLDGAVIRVVENPGNGVLQPLASLWSDVHVAEYAFPINNGNDFCLPWAISEIQMNNHIIGPRPACPCTLRAARIDSCRFSPDPFCNIDNRNNPLNCYRKPGAIHCVRARVPNAAGHGQECCYDSDGNILNIANNRGGGFFHLVHHSAMVPFFTNYLVDVVPWYHCCYLSFFNVFCNVFARFRPSQLCDGYIGPRRTWAGGDPHFVSLDGLRFTFNGLGEFLLIDINDGEFVAHVRTSEIDDEDVNATVITAVAAKHVDSDTFYMAVSPSGATDIRIRTEDADDTIGVTFETTPFWEADGLEIFEATEDEDVVTVVQFPGGIALQVLAFPGMLVVRLLLPEDLIDLPTKGLLGIWNGDTEDDLTDSNGVVQPQSFQGILAFGNSWNVSFEEALFYRQPGDSPPNFFPDFIPIDTPTNILVPTERIQEICGGDAFCVFDFLATGAESFANVTMNAVTTFAEDEMEIEMNEENCPALEETAVLKVIVAGSMVGQSATYYCVDGYTLIGNEDTICTEDPETGIPSWSNEPPTCQLNLVPPVSTCPDGWIYSSGQCYRVFGDGDSDIGFGADYEGRQQACQDVQGTLAIFEPYNTFSGLLAQLIPSTPGQLFAIGLDDIPTGGLFQWLDGTTVSQTAWAVGEPDVNENCVFIRSGDQLWEDLPCDTAAQFICQRHASRDDTICGENAEASVGYMLGSESESRRCVATLINERWAVTSASCTWANRVVFGAPTISSNPLPPAQIMEFTIFIHPMFDSFSKSYDIALLLLNEPVDLSSSVNPMCIQTSDTNVNCASTSWGTFQNDIPDMVQSNTFISLSNDVCDVSVDPFASVDIGIKQCIANGNLGSFVPCEQDAGAPFHCVDPQTNRETLVAVTAEGICASTTMYQRLEVATRVNTNRFLSSATEGDFFYCRSNGIVFRKQLCNNELDCPLGDDEIGCAPAQFGEIFTIRSPKFGLGPTNFADRSWLFRSRTSQILITVSSFTLSDPNSSLTIGTGTIPNQPGTVEIAVTSAFSQPLVITAGYVWIVWHKESINMVEEFEASVEIR